MKKSGKLAIALVGIALGAVLLFFGNRAGKENTDTPLNTPPEISAQNAEDYRADLESRMEAICGQVAGVGTVDVVVTLEGGFTYVYATDRKITVGGETTTYITVGNGNSEAPIYIGERPPAIAGIGVVCSGGMDPTVRREVTSLLSAAFGVGSNKIYVTGRK
jgi:stage III sporulation protein AG